MCDIELAAYCPKCRRGKLTKGDDKVYCSSEFCGFEYHSVN